MLPVQVRSVSSSGCSLFEASALLGRFLCSDACSDSLAREYVANVAQALQDSKSGLCGGPESPGHPQSHAKEPVLSFLGDARSDRKRRVPFVEDAGESLKVELVLPGAEHVSGRHTKKRGHSAIENGFEGDLPAGTSGMQYAALMHHDKKRRKGEKHKTETESVINELYGSDNQSHHVKKRWKEEQQMDTERLETDHLALDNQRLDGKRRKKKEKQGKDKEAMETGHVPENMCSPMCLPLAQRNVEVSYMNANNVKVSITPMSWAMEEFAGLSKRNWKEGKMFPMATQCVEKEREKTDREVSLVEFENLDFNAKTKIKKKKRRKELSE